eukprot:2139110-Alexandrium_andersonii.AAC.1
MRGTMNCRIPCTSSGVTDTLLAASSWVRASAWSSGLANSDSAVGGAAGAAGSRLVKTSSAASSSMAAWRRDC